MHVHFRGGERMKSVVPMTARQFGRAIVMPNGPMIFTTEDAKRYHDEIMVAVPTGVKFTPLMTLYLTPKTSPDEIRKAKRSGIVHSLKVYPGTHKGGQDATTGSAEGVVDLRDIEEQLHTASEVDMPVALHGETGRPEVDVYARENVFYDEMFSWITKNNPKLRLSFEHITTARVARLIERAAHKYRLGATITPQHLLVNRNYMLGGQLRPHAFCKPILKEETDRLELLRVATSGNPRFFLGTDSAPHAQYGEAGKSKECDCGCAGCFTAHAAIELYAEAFESAGNGGLNYLNDFASRFGTDFYELPRNEETIALAKEEWKAKPYYQFGSDNVVPFRQEEPLKWKLTN
jgi:dihydroorotase